MFILVLSITISIGQKTSVSIKTAHAYYRDKGPLTLKIEKNIRKIDDCSSCEI